MAKMTPRTLSGFMELLPAPQQQMERIMEVLRKTYSLYGFTPLDTPVIESSEVLLAKAGGETEKQIYRFQKGDSDLSLRFDLTVPLAKYVALHYNELSFPFRRYQIGKVYRGERAQRGRFREFYQADIDIIGDGKLDITNEAEIPSIIYQTFSTLGLKRFQIRVNNRKILNGFYALLGLTEKSADVMRTVDKLDKIGPEKVKTILVEDFAVSEADADEILKFIAIKGTIKQAVMLGLAATISHTAVVWLIAFGGMVISKRFTAQSAEPWLQLISAVIIISTAFWMFWRTWRGERNWLENMHEHDHEHHQHDHEDHHDHGHHHHHEHGEYQDAHARAHANDIKRRFDGREVTNWQILLFGLTGGLIPCPAAITVLLICIQLKALTLGATLVVSFSIGLALTLVTVGVGAAISVQQVAKRWSGFNTLAKRAPYFSSLLIGLVGVYMGVHGFMGIMR